MSNKQKPKIINYWCYGINEKILICPICQQIILIGKIVNYNNKIFHYNCWEKIHDKNK